MKTNKTTLKINLQSSITFTMICTMICILCWGKNPIAAVAGSLEITPQPGQENLYQTRWELLMDATRHIGAVSPDGAAAVWAEGLRKRSAALQYAVMTADLQERYMAHLDAIGSNWVTGLSSPWVDGFQIVESDPGEDGRAGVKLRFTLAASTGVLGNYDADLRLTKEGDFWRVCHISTEEALRPYTLWE